MSSKRSLNTSPPASAGADACKHQELRGECRAAAATDEFGVTLARRGRLGSHERTPHRSRPFPVYPQKQTSVGHRAMSALCRFCCRSPLLAAANSDSVSRTRFATEADNDGEVEARTGAAFLRVPARRGGTRRSPRARMSQMYLLRWALSSTDAIKEAQAKISATMMRFGSSILTPH